MDHQNDPLRLGVITLFPEMFTALTQWGVTGRAFQEGRCELGLFNPRHHATDRHGTVDDRPYGGGPGMVMKPGLLQAALTEAKATVGEAALVIAMTPQGKVFSDAKARALANAPGLILVAGRYEGIDERFIDASVDEELSVGDYVVSGGELPAMVVLDAVIRQLPGVLGHASSAVEDSFADGLLDCPHYTRPEVYEGRSVPAVLLSGDHGAIARWRRAQSLRRTIDRRPDLFEGRSLAPEDRQLLREWHLLHSGE
jgi:tRNA (guanine37-N1)-methyltransferase